MLEPTTDQIAQYREDGFLIVEDFIPMEVVERLRDRFDRIFNGELELAVEPDEYKWQKGRDPEDVQRLVAGIWRSDPVIAEQTLFGPHAQFAAKLEGVSGVRLWADLAMWKPEGGKPFDIHQDAAYMCWLDPVHNFTCWIALDDTRRDSGTLSYVRGSHKWGAHAASGASTLASRSDDWLEHMKQYAPAGEEVELVPLEISAGSAAFHSAWVWHGSGPNTRAGTIRRSYSVHMFPTGSKHHPTVRHPSYSRYLRPGTLELDEAFFPVLWSADGYRSPWFEDHCSARPVSAFSSEAVETVGLDKIEVEPWKLHSVQV